MNRSTLGAWLLCLSALAFTAKAADSPESIVAAMNQRVLIEATAPGGITDIAKLRSLVETVILPNLDFSAMTSRAVGVKWRSATEAQRSQLMAGFQEMLIKTYAGAFSQARGAKFKIQRVVPLGDQTSEVRAEVAVAGSSEPIAMNYRMALQDGAWKIVDVSVGGVWLVPAYRSQFAPVLQNGDVDALIRALQEKAAR